MSDRRTPRKIARVPGFVILDGLGETHSARKLVRVESIESITDMYDTRNRNNREFVGTIIRTATGESISMIGQSLDEVAAKVRDEIEQLDYEEIDE